MTEEKTYFSPIEVYDAFQESMLAGTDDWKEWVGVKPTFKGPSIDIEGRKAFIEMNEAWFEAIERQVVQKVATCEDLVIAHLSITLTTKADKAITLEAVEWYSIPSGKIESITIYMDTAPLKKIRQ